MWHTILFMPPRSKINKDFNKDFTYYFVADVNSWMRGTHKFHENWATRNSNYSTVPTMLISLLDYRINVCDWRMPLHNYKVKLLDENIVNFRLFRYSQYYEGDNMSRYEVPLDAIGLLNWWQHCDFRVCWPTTWKLGVSSGTGLYFNNLVCHLLKRNQHPERTHAKPRGIVQWTVYKEHVVSFVS